MAEAQQNRRGPGAWTWLIAIVLVAVAAFFFADGPMQVQELLEPRSRAVEDESRNYSDSREVSREIEEDALNESEKHASRGETEEARGDSSPRPRQRASNNEEAADNSHCEDMGEFSRCRSRAWLSEAPCIENLRYTRVPAEATRERMDQLTQALVRSVCAPESGEEPVPEEGCRGEGSRRVCWRFDRVEEPPQQ